MNDEYAWRQAKAKEVLGRLKPLAADKAPDACTRWIQHTSKEAEPALLQLLRSCTEPGHLAAIDTSLRKAIDSWQHRPDDMEPQTGWRQSLSAPCTSAPPFACALDMISCDLFKRTHPIH